MSLCQEAAAKKAQEAAFVPEEEEEEEDDHSEQPGIPAADQGATQAANSETPTSKVPQPGTLQLPAQPQATEHTRQELDAGAVAGDSPAVAADEAPQDTGPAPLGPGLNVQKRSKPAGAPQPAKQSGASQARLMADLAVLQGLHGVDPSQAGSKDEDQSASWQPPENQKGDGRTSLNDQLGY